MAKYHLTNQAVLDLDSIWDYTLVTWGERQADEYYNAFIRTFSDIAKQPCFLDREYVEIHSGLYRRSCHKHLVFYRIADNNEVEIVRILRQRIDIDEQLQQ